MESLREHKHEYYDDSSTLMYDKYKDCYVKDILMRCMICGHEKHEYIFLDNEGDERNA